MTTAVGKFFDSIKAPKKERRSLTNESQEKQNEILAAAVKEEIARLNIDISTLDLELDGPFTGVIYQRYLKARNYDLDDSCEMLVTTIKWRLVKQPSRILIESCIDILKLDYIFIHGLDNEGTTIVWISVKSHVNFSGKDAQYECLVLWMMEYGMKKWRAGEIKSPYATIVFDMAGFNMDNMDYHVVKFLADSMQAHYPEVLSHLYVVDAPKVFQACWKLIKGWLDPRTVKKIDFVTKADLGKHIDPAIIPISCGGACAHTKAWETKQ